MAVCRYRGPIPRETKGLLPCKKNYEKELKFCFASAKEKERKECVFIRNRNMGTM